MLRFLATGLTFLVLSGCSGRQEDADDSFQRVGLSDIGTAYQMYLGEMKRPPRSPADLRKYGNGLPLLTEALESNDFVVFWGVNTDQVPTAASTILAYHKNAQDNAGFVLFADGSVRKVTAQEFSSIPKVANSGASG